MFRRPLSFALALVAAALMMACGDTAVDAGSATDPDAKATRGPACGTFSDVGRDHWAYGAIEGGAAAGLWAGCGQGRFCPDDGATRAMAVAILGNAAGVQPVRATGDVFSDVPSSHWAAGMIEAFHAQGLIAGCGEGRFCPDGPLTRAQMAALVSSVAGYDPTPNASSRFSDVPETHWALGWIETARANGIMAGCAADRFCPDDKATRAQLAAVTVSAFNVERAELCEPDPSESPLAPGSLAGLRIAIDVGHGWTSSGTWDPGAVNPADRSITEYLANVKTVAYLRPMLEAAGARVSVFDYARNTNQFLTLRQKGARAAGHDVFISVHHNAFNASAQGTEVLVDNWVGTSADRRLAQALQDGMMDSIWNGDRRYDRGVKSQALGVLRGADGRVPVKVLVECYFIDVGRPDVDALAQRSALGLARGLGNWAN